MLVGGERVAAASGEWLESAKPYTGKPWALVPRGADADVERAGSRPAPCGSTRITSRARCRHSPGYERSGFGRESGLLAIREFVQEKSVWIETSDADVPNPFIIR